MRATGKGNGHSPLNFRFHYEINIFSGLNSSPDLYQRIYKFEALLAIICIDKINIFIVKLY